MAINSSVTVYYQKATDRVRHTVYKAEHNAERGMYATEGRATLQFPSGRKLEASEVMRVSNQFVTVAEMLTYAKRAAAQVTRLLGDEGAMARAAWRGGIKVGRGKRGGGDYCPRDRVVRCHRAAYSGKADAVRLVTLTHEMAHGLAVAGASDPTHGATFRAAHCVTWALCFGSSLRLHEAYAAAGLRVATAEALTIAGHVELAHLVTQTQPKS